MSKKYYWTSIKEIPSYYWKQDQTITDQSGNTKLWYEVAESNPDYKVMTDEEGRPIGKQEIINWKKSYYTSDQLDRTDKEEIRQKKADENPIANQPKVKRVSDYEALFGNTRVQNVRRAWQNNPQVMKSFKDANDAVGYTTIAGFGLGSGLVQNALKWGNTLMTPSTYTDLIGLPYQIGTVLNAGTSGYFLYDSTKNFIQDPSLENTVYIGLSTIPMTRTGTDETVNTLGKALSKIAREASPKLGNKIQKINANNQLERELVNYAYTPGLNKIYKKLQSHYNNAWRTRDELYNGYMFDLPHKEYEAIVNKSRKINELESKIYNLEYDIDNLNYDLHSKYNHKLYKVLPESIFQYSSRKYNKLEKFLDQPPRSLQWSKKRHYITPLSHTHPYTEGKSEIPIFEEFTKTGKYDIPVFGSSERVIGNIDAPIYKILDNKGKYIEQGSWNVPDEYVQAQKHNIKYVEDKVPGAVTFGSSQGTQVGLPHITDDYDVYVTSSDLNNIENLYGNRNNWKIKVEGRNGNPTETYTIKLDDGKYGDASNIDLNVLYSTDDGTGTLATERSLEAFKQLFPDDYHLAIRKALNTGSHDWIDNIKINKTPEQLKQAIKENAEIKTVMDAFNSDKTKHAKRALQYLMTGDPEIVHKALIKNMQSQIGSNGRVAPVTIDQFNNIEENKKLLNKLGAPTQFQAIASDPAKMRNYFEYWWQNHTLASRGVDDLEDMSKAWHNANLFMRQWSGGKGGTAAGSGLNMVLFGNSGHGLNLRSVYGHIQPKINIPKNATPNDIVDAVNTQFGLIDKPFTEEQKRQISNILSKYNIHDQGINSVKQLHRLVIGNDADLTAAANEIGEVLNINGVSNQTYGNSIYFGGFRHFNDTDDIVKIGHPKLYAERPTSYYNRNQLLPYNVSQLFRPLVNTNVKTLTNTYLSVPKVQLPELTPVEYYKHIKNLEKELSKYLVNTKEYIGRLQKINSHKEQLQIVKNNFKERRAVFNELNQYKTQLDKLYKELKVIQHDNSDIEKLQKQIEHYKYLYDKYQKHASQLGLMLNKARNAKDVKYGMNIIIPESLATGALASHVSHYQRKSNSKESK